LNKFFILAALALLTLVASPVLGTGSAPAWQVDPDSTDPAGFAMSVIGLPAPDPTIGDTDTTAVGVGTDAVGIDDSLTNPPPDPADKDPGHIYYVDNTPGTDCKATPYTTIQAGVDASGPGDTVKVCPGTYPEQVRINGHGHDGLKLESLKPLQAVIQWPTPESFPRALVDFNTVDHVTLRGFTVTGPYPTFPAGDRHEGVLVENAFDEHIHHNHITMIRDVNPGQRGNQEGDAVAIGRRTTVAGTPATDPGSAHVDRNLIDTYQKNGVQVVNVGSSAHVDHNVITGPTAPNLAGPNGVVVIRGAAAAVDHNLISNNQFGAAPISSGVIVFQAPAGSSRVDHNRIVDNDNGIQTYIQQTGLEISHNDVFQSLADAIVLCGDATRGCQEPVTGNVVRQNKVEDNGGSGILLLDADSNLLKNNQFENNGTAAIGDTTDGIRVDVYSTENEILNNHLANNAFHDCHDDSIGSGSGGTANTWNGDKGQTENRDGLCGGAVVTP